MASFSSSATIIPGANLLAFLVSVVAILVSTAVSDVFPGLTTGSYQNHRANMQENGAAVALALRMNGIKVGNSTPAISERTADDSLLAPTEATNAVRVWQMVGVLRPSGGSNITYLQM